MWMVRWWRLKIILFLFLKENLNLICMISNLNYLKTCYKTCLISFERMFWSASVSLVKPYTAITAAWPLDCLPLRLGISHACLCVKSNFLTTVEICFREDIENNILQIKYIDDNSHFYRFSSIPVLDRKTLDVKWSYYFNLFIRHTKGSAES